LAGKGQPRTGGRKKGTPNRVTTAVRAAILGSLADLDEHLKRSKLRWKKGYLVWLGMNEPQAYATLLGKALPREIKLDNEPLVVIRDYTGRANGEGEK
jgi:hypothetical protein